MITSTRRMRPALAILVLCGCSKSQDRDRAVPVAAPPAIAAATTTTTAQPIAKAPLDVASWTMSSARCPVVMSATPAPKPGQKLGDLALQVLNEPGQLGLTIVKSIGEVGYPGPSEHVPVYYVERSHTDPAPDLATRSFIPGSSEGVAYIFDKDKGEFACMANVNAESSDGVTSLQATERNATMWLTMDLMFAIERQIVANARAISRSDGGAGVADAGRPARKR